ncbi:MAG: hypothetical protein J7J96_06785 [Sulfurimonas sp.]|nr:hypothetical protein [Sulfurimonas sp.]
MFGIEFLVSFSFMTLLFLRQISILKQPNKINYAPLMIGIGAISSVVHFIIHPDVNDVILLLRESFFPLLVALFFYIVMNILHQTQQTQNAKIQDEFTKVLVEQVTELKEYMLDLETRMTNFQLEDRVAQKEIRTKFIEDIKVLDAIQINQTKFLEKFDGMDKWHKDVSKEFENFIEVQMPGLDNVVHKHIDILRVAEQDHYNKLNNTLQKALDNKGEISEDMQELKDDLQTIKSISGEIADNISKRTLEQLSGVTKSFENEIISLKSHSEGVKTSLYESESKLATIREQSEMIMKQMLLSSKKMNDLEKQNSGLYDIYSTIKELMTEMEMIKADYVKAQSQLSMISSELKSSESEQVDLMKNQIKTLGEVLTKKIEDSLDKLHQHYHIAGDDITQSVQILAKKAQLQKGYTQLDN